MKLILDLATKFVSIIQAFLYEAVDKTGSTNSTSWSWRAYIARHVEVPVVEARAYKCSGDNMQKYGEILTQSSSGYHADNDSPYNRLCFTCWQAQITVSSEGLTSFLIPNTIEFQTKKMVKNYHTEAAPIFYKEQKARGLKLQIVAPLEDYQSKQVVNTLRYDQILGLVIYHLHVKSRTCQDALQSHTGKGCWRRKDVDNPCSHGY